MSDEVGCKTCGKNLLKSALGVAQHALKTGRVRATPEVTAKRIVTCKGCEHLNKKDRCQVCGCFVEVKARLESERCPIGRW